MSSALRWRLPQSSFAMHIHTTPAGWLWICVILASFLEVLCLFGESWEQRTTAQIDELKRANWKQGPNSVREADQINPSARIRAKMFVPFNNLMRLYASAFDHSRAPVPAHLGDDSDFTGEILAGRTGRDPGVVGPSGFAGGVTGFGGAADGGGDTAGIGRDPPGGPPGVFMEQPAARPTNMPINPQQLCADEQRLLAVRNI
jgi:hypothetical protein